MVIVTYKYSGTLQERQRIETFAWASWGRQPAALLAAAMALVAAVAWLGACEADRIQQDDLA
jgi:hypothetical protein